jgi:DNA-binding Lrp family transcriptional regulator
VKKKHYKPSVKQILSHAATDAEEKLILIVLREYADKEGWCSRSYAKIAEKADLSEGTVKARIAALCNRGILHRTDLPVKQWKPRYAYRIHLYHFLGVATTTEELPKTLKALVDAVTPQA